MRKTVAPKVFAASLAYASSQRLRKHEESVDCSKTVGGLAKVRAVLVFALAPYVLVRLPELPDPK